MTRPLQEFRHVGLARLGRTARGAGLVLALVVAFTAFALARPTTFPTMDNVLSMLTLTAPLAVLATTLTVVLILGEFDLSIGAATGMAGAVAVVSQSALHVTALTAIALALLAGAATGLISGLLSAVMNLSSFIVTLGVGTMLTGVEYTLTGQKTVYSGIDPGYLLVGQGNFLGLNGQVWIAVAVAIVTYVAMHFLEFGRFAYATGSSPAAARLSGLRVSRLKVLGFVCAGVGAALAGIMLTSQAASSFSNAGSALLLPAFGAVFLGTTLGRHGQFSVLGTILGVALLGVLQTGLTMLQLSTAAILLVQGGVLVAAVLVSRLGSKAA